MKRVLILTAGFGEGHNSAARGVRDALAQIAPDCVVEMRDLFPEVYGSLNEYVRRTYVGLINRWPRSWGVVYRWLDRKTNFAKDFARFTRLRTYLEQLVGSFQPDSVVSTFPAYPYVVGAIRGGAARPNNVVIVTDSITVNAIWCLAPGDYFLLPNEQSATLAVKRGMPHDRIKVFGFPVSPKFAELAKQPRAALSSTPHVLYMINAGTRSAPEIVKRLLDRSLALTVTVGRDERLLHEIQCIAGPRKFEVIGWTDQMPRLLRESDLLIGKAGGATVQETIAAGCPMVINHIVAGQEEGNAQLIVETNSGAVGQSPAEVATLVDRAFANNAAIWNQWSANISKLSRPRASLDIAEFLLSI